MKRTRDWRRAQRDRVIAHTERWMRAQGWFTDPYTRWDAERTLQIVRKNARTPHPCSGLCCGNPRKWLRGKGAMTMQERRAYIISNFEWHDPVL